MVGARDCIPWRVLECGVGKWARVGSGRFLSVVRTCVYGLRTDCAARTELIALIADSLIHEYR